MGFPEPGASFSTVQTASLSSFRVLSSDGKCCLSAGYLWSYWFEGPGVSFRLWKPRSVPPPPLQKRRSGGAWTRRRGSGTMTLPHFAVALILGALPGVVSFDSVLGYPLHHRHHHAPSRSPQDPYYLTIQRRPQKTLPPPPFLLCFSLFFFSQLFVRPPQTAILLFLHFFPMGMVLIPVSCTMS